MIDENQELPVGWKLSALGEVVTPVNVKVDPTQNSDTQYIGLEHVEAHTMRLLGHGMASDVKSTKTKFSAGDVLYGKLRPYLNKVTQPNFDGICSTDFLVFTESVVLDRGYLANYLNQLWVADQAHHLSNGVELPRVDWKSLSRLLVAYPSSKDEQRAIVSLVDAFRRSRSSAITHLDSAYLAIERFRQAVLAAACSGHLTAEWRASYRSAVASEPPVESDNIPNTWQLLPLGELAESIRGGTTEVPSNDPSDYPILRSSSVRPFKIDYNDVRFLTADQSQREDYFLHDGDLLITRLSGSIEYVGNCAVVESLGDRRIQYPDRLFCCRLKDPSEARYIEICFAGPMIRKQIEGASRSAAGHQRISISDLENFTIARPPHAEQLEMRQRVSTMLRLADNLLRRLDTASRQLDRSSQAVLAKAFRGELSTTASEEQNAELVM